jgi:hypothetical protein
MTTMNERIHYRDYLPFEADKLFMAQMMPDEGLDIWLGQFPLATAKYTSPLQLCLFTSQTASTVITHAQTFANITETTYTSYARQTLAAATWGAIAERPTNLGRQVTYPQVTFPTVGATGATINGFHINNNANTVTIGQANFDDGLAVVLATSDVIKVTPTVALLH